MSDISNEKKEILTVAESSMENSQVGQAGGNVVQNKIGKYIKINHPGGKKMNIAIIITLSILVLTVCIIILSRNSIKDTDQQINLNGSSITNSNLTQIGEIKIYPGDSPEVKRKKVEQAKRILANEVITNISNIDYRLGFIANLENKDNFEQKLRSVRLKVAPALDEIASENYRKIHAQQQATSMREIFNSYPLNIDVGGPIIQVLIDGNVNPEVAQSFYKNLREAQEKFERLLQTLGDTFSTSFQKEEVMAYKKRCVSFYIKQIKNNSEIAYLSGLLVLNSLEIELPGFENIVSNLKYLQPPHMLDSSEAVKLMGSHVEETVILLAEHKSLVEESDDLLTGAFAGFAEIEEKLKIKPTDTESQVIGKAISLRHLGRTSDAVAAFYRYGEMFSKSDPCVKRYVEVAQAFTVQISNLGIEGGVYIFKLAENGNAQNAGIKVGDILIEYNGNMIKNMELMVNAIRDCPKGEPVKITYLRLGKDEYFVRTSQTVIGNPLGAGFMAI